MCRNCSTPSHEGSIYCLYHCKELNHGHCTRNCIELDPNCNKHCRYQYCDSPPHKGYRCVEHCDEEGHGHCKLEGCSNDEGYEGYCDDCRAEMSCYKCGSTRYEWVDDHFCWSCEDAMSTPCQSESE